MAFLRYQLTSGSNELINIGCCRDRERSKRQGRGKTAEEVFKGKVENGKVYWLVLPIPSPYRSECRDWRGIYKVCLQNLEPQGVRGQNLENKVLGGGCFEFTHGVADAYDASIQIVRQGQTSHERQLRLWISNNFLATDHTDSHGFAKIKTRAFDPEKPAQIRGE